MQNQNKPFDDATRRRHENSRCRSFWKRITYTQKRIGIYTGFSVSFISDLERGKETCEIGKAIEIVNLLGMDLCMEKRGK